MFDVQLLTYLVFKITIRGTWILNIGTNTIHPGPALNQARYRHGCARTSNGSIIVAGGKYNSKSLKSTEILKMGDLEWTNGPDLKEKVQLNEVVMSRTKDYIAYSIGGWNYDGESSEIYGLTSDMNEWKFLDNMNEPRYWGSAVNIPFNMIPWCEI